MTTVLSIKCWSGEASINLDYLASQRRKFVSILCGYSIYDFPLGYCGVKV
jgi:hypothetical protein